MNVQECLADNSTHENFTNQNEVWTGDGVDGDCGETETVMIPTLGGDGGKGVVILSGGLLKLIADNSFSRAMLGGTSAENSPRESLEATMNNRPSIGSSTEIRGTDTNVSGGISETVTAERAVRTRGDGGEGRTLVLPPNASSSKRSVLFARGRVRPPSRVTTRAVAWVHTRANQSHCQRGISAAGNK